MCDGNFPEKYTFTDTNYIFHFLTHTWAYTNKKWSYKISVSIRKGLATANSDRNLKLALELAGPNLQNNYQDCFDYV